jgi:uncharacterized membrane protein YphA (DoxX/SURF4 family)
MSTRKTLFWTATGLTVAALAAGGAMDLFPTDDMKAQMAHLGYPAYVATLLGVWKLLGAAAIAAPRLPRLKEWAYAGVLFDLTGAAVSHASSGDPVAKIATPLALLAIALASWALRPAARRLDEAVTAAPPAAAHERGLRAA